MAAGTRTAPTINGTPSYVLASFGFVDLSGDERSVVIQGPAAATSAQWEAIADAYQDATQSSLWRANIQNMYEGDKDPSNAAPADQRNSVYDNVTVLWKNTARVSRDVFIPAPAPEIMFGDMDEIDPASTELVALFTAILAVSTGFTVRSARYTERKEINKAVKF